MVKTEFTIKDLENLSNVKAHTIRIWEKRYNLLSPDRTDTNIRRYDLENLKKLLNISFLYRSGHKISKLAEMDAGTLKTLINDNLSENQLDYAIEIFKTTMIEFDDRRFDLTLQQLLKEKTFSEIFAEIFVPLLQQTGTLWHSGTIDPSHEHFLSEKIKQAIVFQTLNLQKSIAPLKKTDFTLFLPLEEIHEIGLLYANYEVKKAGFSTLYLGANVPLESLKHVHSQKKNTIFLTYFTVQPESVNFDQYVQKFQEVVNPKKSHLLWILGDRAKKGNDKNIRSFQDITSFLTALEEL